jgi:hypothetical protein
MSRGVKSKRKVKKERELAEKLVRCRCLPAKIIQIVFEIVLRDEMLAAIDDDIVREVLGVEA